MYVISNDPSNMFREFGNKIIQKFVNNLKRKIILLNLKNFNKITMFI